MLKKIIFFLSLTTLLFGCTNSGAVNNTFPISEDLSPPTWIQGTWKADNEDQIIFASNEVTYTKHSTASIIFTEKFNYGMTQEELINTPTNAKVYKVAISNSNCSLTYFCTLETDGKFTVTIAEDEFVYDSRPFTKQ